MYLQISKCALLQDQKDSMLIEWSYKKRKHRANYLYNKSLPTPARSDANHCHVGGFVDKVLKAVENTTSSCRGTAVDATLVDGLAGDTGMGIDVIMTLKGGEKEDCYL